MKLWSRHWISSKKPGKKRKYIYNAPLHIRRKLMSSHLSKELREKLGRRSLPVRVGDVVRIMRGEFKGKEGEVEKVDRQRYKVYVKGVQKEKKDGSAYKIGLASSNLMIIKLKEDKMRLKKKEKKGE